MALQPQTCIRLRPYAIEQDYILSNIAGNSPWNKRILNII